MWNELHGVYYVIHSFSVFIFTIDESESMNIRDPQVTTDNQEIKKNDGIL